MAARSGASSQSSDAVSWWGEGLPTRFEIVGVAGDVKFLGLDKETAPAYYLSVRQFPIEDMQLVVRGSAGTSGAARNLPRSRPRPAAARRIDDDARLRRGARSLAPQHAAHARLRRRSPSASRCSASTGCCPTSSRSAAASSRSASPSARGRSQVLGDRPRRDGAAGARRHRPRSRRRARARARCSPASSTASRPTDPASLGGGRRWRLGVVMFLASGLPARRAARIAPSEVLKGE